MSIDISASCDGIHLRVAGELTIHTATETWAVLTEALTASPDVSIALDEVTEFDTVGLQLLLCARRAPQANVQITSLSPSVARVIELANVGHVLKSKPSAIP